MDDIPNFNSISEEIKVEEFELSRWLKLLNDDNLIWKVTTCVKANPTTTFLKKVEQNYYKYRNKCIECFIFDANFLLELIKDEVNILVNDQVRLHILKLFNDKQIDILYDIKEYKIGWSIIPGINHSGYLSDDSLKEEMNNSPIEFLAQTYYKFL